MTLRRIVVDRNPVDSFQLQNQKRAHFPYWISQDYYDHVPAGGSPSKVGGSKALARLLDTGGGSLSAVCFPG